MENIYKFPKNDLINIKDEMEKLLAILQLSSVPKSAEDVKTIMNCSAKEFEELTQSVCLDNLLDIDKSLPIAEFDEEKIEKCITVPIDLKDFKEEFNLETSKELLNFRKNIVGRFKTKKQYPFGKTEFIYKFIKNDFLPKYHNEDLIEPYTDVIISVRIYRPFRYIVGRNTYGPTFQEEFLVLGSQFLTELRDKISCNFNNRCIIEISSDPDTANPVPKTNPGFFFITDTFYNDTRDSDNHDYSEIIRKWLAGKKEFKGSEFKALKMEETRFFDLTLRLGFPQVYQHNGNCEHVFCISSAQIITEEDNLNKSNYPILRTISLQRVSLCNMCGETQYSYVVRNSNRQIHDPAFLCQQCFLKYHYVDGKKIGNFKAYRVSETETYETSDADDSDYNEDVQTTIFEILEVEDQKLEDIQE